MESSVRITVEAPFGQLTLAASTFVVVTAHEDDRRR